jgi:hypothetical protein
MRAYACITILDMERAAHRLNVTPSRTMTRQATSSLSSRSTTPDPQQPPPTDRLWLDFGSAIRGRGQLVLVHARRTARKPLAHEIASVAADKRAACLVGRRYVGRVVHGDRMLVSKLGSMAEQSCRRRYDPTVARDPVDCFQQWSDATELAPTSNRYVRHLLTGKIECGERRVGIGQKRLGWSV